MATAPDPESRFVTLQPPSALDGRYLQSESSHRSVKGARQPNVSNSNPFPPMLLENAIQTAREVQIDHSLNFRSWKWHS
jgi:hypothetical protein